MVTVLATELAARGHEIALSAPSGPRDEDLRDVPHLRMRLDDHGRAATGVARSAAHLARAIHRFSPDLVHAQNVKSAVTARAAVLAARPWRRPPVVTTFQGVLPAEYRRSARLLRAADHVACVSADLLGNLVSAGYPPQRASLIHNAVTPAEPLDPADRAALDRELRIEGAPVVAIVGRLVPQKAHERFVVATRRIADALPEVRFLIVGEGPRRQEIERGVDMAGLGSQVRFTGMRSDAREIIARADVVVFSSEWEGLAVAALEALAAGTPVVSTDVQGMRELLTDGAGAVVPLDDGAALGDRVITLLRNEPERQAMGGVGRELIARDFSADHMFDAYERLYERLNRSAAPSLHG
jgi:glycosyltransferase involved in cell wall biosynthesis